MFLDLNLNGKDGFEILKQFLINNQQPINEIILLESRWNALMQQGHEGTISQQDKEVACVQVKKSLLVLVEQKKNLFVVETEDNHFNYQKKQLDEKSLKILSFFLDGLTEDENKEMKKPYPKLERDKIDNWVKLSYETIYHLQGTFNDDLFHFLNNGYDVFFVVDYLALW